MSSKVKSKDESNDKSKNYYWLVYGDDRGNREDCSVFYCDLVIAKTAIHAIDTIACGDKYQRRYLRAQKMQVKRANSDVELNENDFRSLGEDSDVDDHESGDDCGSDD